MTMFTCFVRECCGHICRLMTVMFRFGSHILGMLCLMCGAIVEIIRHPSE